MSEQPFHADVRVTANAVILDLHGEINLQADEALNAAYTTAVTHQPAIIVLNFSDVVYVNSTGIALIVGLMAQARKARQSLRVYGLSEHYKEIFHITRLTDFMQVCENEGQALQ